MLKTNQTMRVQGTNQTNQVATGRRGLMRKLDSVMHRCTSLFSGNPHRSNLPFSLENLEARQMLAADIALTPGHWTNWDTSNADAYDATDGVVILGSGTSGITGITIQEITDGGAVDTAVLNITVQADASADAVVIELATNKQFGSINLIGLNAGTTAVTLRIGSGITTTTGGTDGRQEATVDGVTFGANTWDATASAMITDMNQTYTGDATGGIIGTVAPTAGYAAVGTGIVFGSTTVANMPVDLHILTGATGTLGSVSAPDSDMTLTGPTNVHVGSAGQITFAGALTTGASDITILADDDASGTGVAGYHFGSVSTTGAGYIHLYSDGVGAGGFVVDNGPVTVSGAGSFRLDSDNTGGNNDTFLGPVTLNGVTVSGTGFFELYGGGLATGFGSAVSVGNVILSNSGDFILNTQTDGSFAAPLTVGTVAISGNNGGSFELSAAGNGSFNTVVFGDISIVGNNAGNTVTIGSATNSAASVDLGNISNSNLDDAGDVAIDFLDVAGAFDTDTINLVGAGVVNKGDINIYVHGTIGNGLTIADGSTVILGDDNEAGDNGAFSFQVGGKITGSVVIGDVTNRNTTAGDVALIFGDDISGSFTAGTVNLVNTNATANDGDFSVTAAGIAGGVTIGAATLGDLNLGQGDTGKFSLTATVVTGATLIGAVTLNSTNGASDFDVTYTDKASSGAITLGTITAGGLGNQHNDFHFTSAGTAVNLTAGDISVNAGDNAGTSEVIIQTGGASGILSIGNIDNQSFSKDVSFNLNTDASNKSSSTTLTIGGVTTNNVGNTTHGDVYVTVYALTGLLSIAKGAGQTVSLGDQSENDTTEFIVTVNDSGSAVNIGPVLLNSTSDNADFEVHLNGAGSSGAVDIESITADGTGTQRNDFAFSSAGIITGLTVGPISLNAGDNGGTSGVNITSADASGAIVFGDILNAGNADVAVDLNTDATNDQSVSSVLFHNVSTVNPGNTSTGSVTLNVDAISGNLTVATGAGEAVTLGDIGDGDSSSFTITTYDIGSIGGVNLGDVLLSTGGAVNIGTATAASIGNVATQNIQVNDQGTVNITGATMGNFTATGQWNFLGAGGVTVTAATGAIGTVGPAVASTWDLNFIDGNTSSVNFKAADGIGNATITSVDFDSNRDGTINFAADSDGAGEATVGTQIGSIGAFAVLLQGDNSYTDLGTATPTALDVNDTAFVGSISALTGTTINIAGGAWNSNFTAGNQVALANTGGPGVWTDITFAGSSLNVTINAQNGISSISATGSNGQLLAFVVNSNTDAASEVGLTEASLGALGPVDAVGVAGADSLTGTFTGSNLGTFTVHNGNFSANLTSTVSGTANRNLVTSSITSVTVLNGDINQNSYNNDFTIDDGFTAGISAKQPTPTLGNIALGTLDLDADGGLAGAVRSGGLPLGISASGSLTILVLDTFEGTGKDVQVVTTGSLATNSVGPLTAGGDTVGTGISIGTVDVGGDIGNVGSDNGIILTTTPGAAVAAQPIFIGVLRMAGSIDRIATSGSGNGDSISINSGFINGDTDEIDAGKDFFFTNSLRIVGGTTGSPVYTITDLSVDYLLVVDGTFTSGVLDTTIVFPADAFGDGVRNFGDGDDATLFINDIEGTTVNASDATGTKLLVLTRNTGTPYTSADDNATAWDVTGIQDDFNGTQHDFRQIFVEGNVYGSDWGADSNNFDGSNAGEPTLGNVQGIEIIGQWDNATTHIFATSLDEIAYGSLTTDRYAATPATNEFSYDNPSGVFGDGVLPPGGNTNGTVEDLNIYTAFAPTNDKQVIIVVPPGASITKTFVGPGGQLQVITFDDSSATVTNSFVIDFTLGHIDDIYIFGEGASLEYNESDLANPATDSTTNIFYGVDYAGLTATEPSSNAINAIDLIEFSSSLGNISVTDINTANNIPASVGDISVGYQVTVDDQNDVTNNGGINAYINDPNNGGGSTGTQVAYDATTGTIYYGSVGNVTVDGSIGAIVSAGGVGNITTNDTVTELTGSVPSAHFGGLVTDGGAGEININGNVTHSLVVGDAVLTTLGANLAPGGGDDLVGIAGTPGFGGNITVTGNLGSLAHWLLTATFTRPGGQPVQSPQSGAYVSTVLDVNELLPSLAGQLANLGNAYGFDQVSAPDGLSANIIVGGNILTATISGKRIIVDQTEDQTNDNITGNIIAGLTGATQTGGNINGDIWSGESIGGVGTVIQAFSADLNGVYDHGGFIRSTGLNASVMVYATGGSFGDITSNILASADIVDLHVTAGSGTGGSLLANITAGLDPLYITNSDGQAIGGSILEDNSTNYILADNNVGSGNTNVVSAAGSIRFTQVSSGLRTDLGVGGVDATHLAFGGDINSDFLAGVAIGATVPSSVNINDSTLPIFQDQNDFISIGTLSAGTVDGVDQDGKALNDMNSNLNGTLVAAGGIAIDTLTIDGNATGNNGVAGGHVAASGMGYKSGTSFSSGTNQLFIGAGSTIVGLLNGTFSAGMFVSRNQAGASPLNPNDLGGLQAGTVLTLGSVDIDGLTVGRWEQSATGKTGGDGINLGELLAGTENGSNASYAPTFSIGATNVIDLNVSVVGRPFIDPQTGPGSGGGTGSPSINNGTDGDAVNVSIAGFGTVSGFNGGVDVRDSGDFNFVLSNIDAITAIGTTNAAPGDPSDPSTLTPHNSGQAGNLNLSITTHGDGATDGLQSGHGLDVEYFLAGFDYFSRIVGATTTPSFWASFGLGSIGGTLFAKDSDATNGYNAGNLSFALVAAGQDITGSLLAQGDITARTGSATTDGSSLIVGGFDADVVAGANASVSIAPLALASQFAGGSISGSIIAGDDIGSSDADTLITIVARGNGETGSISGNIISGAANQLQGPDLFNGGDNESGDLNAFIVAGNGISGNIDAGDTQFAGAATIGVPTSDLAGGNFRGGIWVGAGVDLDINTTADNSTEASLTGNVRTVGDLNVTNVGNAEMGILSENGITKIEVGYGIDGGDLLGNVVAEGVIGEIEVFGNIGSAVLPGLIYTGATITNLAVGNAIGWGATALNMVTHPDSVYISTFGTIFSDIYEGGIGGGATNIYIGGSFDTNASILIGLNQGVTGAGVTLEQAGFSTTLNPAGGTSMIVSQTGPISSGTADAPGYGPDVFLYSTGGAGGGVGLAVTSNGQSAGLGRVIAVDTLNSLTIVDGSIRQVIVDDDFDVAGALLDGATSVLGQFAVDPFSFTFLADSIPSVNAIEHSVNNTLYPANLGTIQSDYNIGTPGVSIGNGLTGITQSDNVAIWVQGQFTGVITSNTGSVGNIVVIGGSGFGAIVPSFDGGTLVRSYAGIGDVYAGAGSIGTGNVFLSATGGIGVISTEDNLTISAASVNVRTNIGGLIARTGDLNATNTVHGSIGLLQASGTISGTLNTETGSIGLDLDNADIFTAVSTNGIYADQGDIFLTLNAGSSIGNISAVQGTVDSTLTAETSIGNVTAGQDIYGGFTARTGSIGNLLAVAGEVDLALTAGTSIGNLTSNLNEVDVNAHAGTSIGNVTAAYDVSSTLTADTGSVGNLTSTHGSVNSTVTAGTSVGNLTATTGTVSSTVIAGTSIGNITGGGNTGGGTTIDGTYTAQAGAIGNVHAVTGDLTGTFTAGTSIGTISADVRDILSDINVTAGGDAGATANIGNVTAGRNIEGGTFTALRGWIGNFHALTGSIGNITDTVIVANGGVVIDPDTLTYVAAPANGRKGVGTVFADLGDINVDITTGGDVGTDPDGTDAVRGGIAAPLGFVYAALKVGGNVGGVSGGGREDGSERESVYLPDTNVVLGSMGFIRNPEDSDDGIHTVGGVNANNPLIITLTDSHNNSVDYRVIVSSGSAEVVYQVNDDFTVTFLSITYTAGENASIQVLTTTGGRTSSGLFGDSSVLVSVGDMVVNGNVQSIKVEGSLDSLTVNGNLAGGTLDVASLGTAYVSGNIGTSASVLEVVHVKSGSFTSLTSGGTNFGLQTVTISNGQTFNFTNTLNNDPTTDSDNTINAYIGKGSALLTINNGYIQHVTLTGGKAASNLVFVASSGALSADALATQATLIKTGATSKVVKGTTIVREFSASHATASVGAISEASKVSLKGLTIEGSLGTLAMGGNLSDLTVAGNVGTANVGGNIANFKIVGNVTGGLDSAGSAKLVDVEGNLNRLFVAKGINTLDVLGNAGLIDGGVSITNASIAGAGGVDILKATNSVSHVNIVGNAGVLTSGQSMSNVFVGGSSIRVAAGAMSNVQITGSVGASVSTGVLAGTVYGQVGLGSAFSLSQIAYLVLGNASASLAQLSAAGNTGPLNGEIIVVPGTNTGDGPGGDDTENNTRVYAAETLFYGGLDARTANNVVVGGHISDLQVQSSPDLALFTAVLDDAYTHVGKRVFSKTNGSIDTTPPVTNAH